MSLFTSLRYLVALHHHKHFGRAAEACHVTQPALSNAIRALEKEFGTAIVKRGRAFESFTPEGEQIFLTAQRMLHEQELLQQSLKSAESAPAGALTLGAVPSVMPIAARFSGMLQKKHPGIRVTLRSLSSQDIETGLENLSLDLALGYTDRIRPGPLTTLWQYDERYFLLRRASQASASGLQITTQACRWADAASHALCLLTPEMHNRTIVDDAFRQAGARVEPVIETNSILALGLAVLDGNVCSVLPGALVGVLNGHGALEAVPLNAPDVVTPIGLIYVDSHQPSHTLSAALRLATDPAWASHVKSNSGLLRA
ncbi:LysR family transcriptional regulator [Rhodoferax sp. GW822-FHT02A01]|uniref:LysR family transcriptional regulator n=1 Tax=Rhodoferax sp. GW822-FHT02A01 TaxID=3141537 RepID=UPI00315DB7B0